MSKSIKSNTRCSGCGVCSVVCPKSAISFASDDKGFYRPIVNDDCIGCGLCIKKCHEHYPNNDTPPLTVYNCSSKQSEVLRASSSGGIFTELATSIIRRGGYVCGAAMVDCSTGKVEHKIVSTLEELDDLRRSKYVESSLLGVFSHIKELIKGGEVLLFVGTPCQCSAIVNYVGRPDNLILIDFICHGTGSPEVLKWYLREQEKKIGKILDVNFRNKFQKSGSYFTLEGEKGELVIENHTANSVGYPYMFSSSLIVADDCVTCKYTTLSRSSDITLADKCDGTGVNFDQSTVLVITEKGKQLLDSLNINRVQINVDAVVKNAWHLTKTSTPNPLRNKFFLEYKTLPYEQVFKKYMILHKPTLFRRVFNKIKKCFNYANQV